MKKTGCLLLGNHSGPCQVVRVAAPSVTDNESVKETIQWVMDFIESNDHLRFGFNSGAGPILFEKLKRLRDAMPMGTRESAPIPMILHCPTCRERHIDAGEFATKPHHTHACQSCGMVWRPAVIPTVGVQFLPGFKDSVFADERGEKDPCKASIKLRVQHIENNAPMFDHVLIDSHPIGGGAWAGPREVAAEITRRLKSFENERAP